MDIVDVLSNLHAFRQLYDLLHNIEEEDVHSSHLKNVHQVLDPKARKLFRHLLDDATQKMLHTRLKVTEALEQPKTMSKLQPHSLSSDTLNYILKNDKDYTSSMTTSEKDEHFPVKSQSAISISSVSPDVSSHKKKRCRACIAKEMKRLCSNKDTTLESNSNTIEQEVGDMKNFEEGNVCAKVVTNAIREIESCISALKLSSGLTHSPISNDVDEYVSLKPGISVSPVEHVKEDVFFGKETNQTVKRESSSRNDTQLTQLSQQQKMIGDNTAATPVQTSETSLVQTNRKQNSRYGKKHAQGVTMRAVFLDDEMPSQRGSRKNKKKITPRLQKESEKENNSSSNSHSSSTWSSKQSEISSSSRANDSEESWSPRNHDSFESSESNSQEILTSSSYDSEEEDKNDHSHEKYPRKSIGRFRELKNKLGLIFQHHHHYHHHHHHHHHGNDRPARKKVQKTLHHEDKRVRNDHGQPGRGGKSRAVRKKTHQGGQFHALMKGLLRHNKNMKKTRGVIRPHGLNKKKVVVNKLQWWQTFRDGGVKLPKRGPVKSGFADKRPKLPMKR